MPLIDPPLGAEHGALSIYGDSEEEKTAEETGKKSCCTQAYQAGAQGCKETCRKEISEASGQKVRKTGSDEVSSCQGKKVREAVGCSTDQQQL